MIVVISSALALEQAQEQLGMWVVKQDGKPEKRNGISGKQETAFTQRNSLNIFRRHPRKETRLAGEAEL